MGSKPIRSIAAFLAGVLGLAASGAAHAMEWYFQSPASKMAQDIDTLHQYVMWLIIVIFVGVFGFMFYACYAHRKSKGHQADAVPREHHGRDPLDGDPGDHPGGDRLAGDQDGDRAEGHLAPPT